jgi:hypothetical protein
MCDGNIIAVASQVSITDSVLLFTGDDGNETALVFRDHETNHKLVSRSEPTHHIYP